MNTFSNKFKTYLSLGLRVFTNKSKADKNGDFVEIEEDIIPWTPLSKPISRARFALVSTAGVHLLSQESFNRYRTDPSYREIYSADISPKNHVVNTCFDHVVSENNDTSLFPVEYLNELAEGGKIGFANYRHFSFSGHLFGHRLAELVHGHLPKVINSLKSDEVDVVILTSNCRRCDHTMRIIQRVLESAGLVTIAITRFSSGKDTVAVPRSLYIVPVSKTVGNGNSDKRSELKVIMGEAIKHLAFTDKPGLQSYVSKYSKDSADTVKDESAQENRYGLNDTVFEPFGHAHSQTEDFAWEAYVKYY